MSNKNSNQLGFVALFITVLIMVVVLGIAASIAILTYNEERISENITKSNQAYYVAEAGLEDNIYRVIKGKKYDAVNSLQVGGGTATISITEEENKKIIKSIGENFQKTKILQATLSIETSTIYFRYGAQVDNWGLEIKANASVIGNVYSNGSLRGQGKGSGSKITGDAWVAGAVAPSSDQRWTTQNSDFPFGLKSGPIFYLDTAQSFVPSVSKVLNKVGLYLKKVGSPPDQTVRILTDNGGSPSDTSLGSGTLKSSKVTSVYSWIDVSLDSPPNLTAGNTYWVMVDVSRDDNNYWIWGKDSSDGYASGTGKYATKDWNSPGVTWDSVSGDLNFMTWLGGDTPTYIDRVWVSKDVYANTITESWIDGDAHYQTIDDKTTVSGVKYPGSPDPATKDLPISYAQIQDWEKAAEAGGVINPPGGNYTPSAGSSLGPIKINGDLTFPSNSLDNPVIITGPIWATGTILAENNSKIKLKTGLASGYPIIADNPSDQSNFGRIKFNNNIVTEDSSQSGKLLFISTNKSLDPANPAIWLYNNVNKDLAQSIVFSLSGIIKVENNAKFKEITGYGIYLENNAEIVYEQGLINANFSSGPGAGWEVVNWKEVE